MLMLPREEPPFLVKFFSNASSILAFFPWGSKQRLVDGFGFRIGFGFLLR